MFKKLIIITTALLLSGCACLNYNPQQELTNIAKRAQVSNVQIVMMCDGQPRTGASATVIRQDPETGKLTLLTANHVVDKKPNTCKKTQFVIWKEKDQNGNELTIPVEIKGKDTHNDLALLESTERIDKKYPIVYIASTNPSVGEEVISVGCPLVDDDIVDTVNKGTVALEGTPLHHAGDLRMGINAGIINGMSGGAVYNMRGELVGVNQMVMLTATGTPLTQFGYAARPSTIRIFLKGQDEL